jgi:hypothetical protein
VIVNGGVPAEPVDPDYRIVLNSGWTFSDGSPVTAKSFVDAWNYGALSTKAGVSPKVISERIGHAEFGFFLQTYAHVLKTDDRDAAEQRRSSSETAGIPNQTMSDANVHKSIHKRRETAPGGSPGAVSPGSGAVSPGSGDISSGDRSEEAEGLI